MTPLEILENVRRHLLSSTLTAVFFLAAAIVYLAVADNLYRADITLIVKQNRESSLVNGQLGGLAALAGLGMDGQGERKSEALALLQSRVITNSFVTDNNLLPILFSKDWDEKTSSWRHPEHAPSVWDAEKLIREHVRTLSEEKRTGIITLSIDWRDPVASAAWASELVSRTNTYIRQRTLQRTKAHLEFLERKLSENNVMEVREAIYKLIEAEMKEYMLAQDEAGNVLYVIDPPVVAKKPISPRPLFVILTAAMAAFATIVLFAVWRLANIKERE